MKRILITGTSGMLGSFLVRAFQDRYDVISTATKDFIHNPAKKFISFDLKETKYNSLINLCNPHIIIHCAAITDGNYCEINPEEAFLVNGHSVKKLLDATSEDVKIIYISTDAVFPSSIHYAKENDLPFPHSVYGKSKELGEFFLRQSDRQYHIIRTTIVGHNINTTKKGFVEWILSSVYEKRSISLFDDVIFTPITIWQISSLIEALINSNTSEKVLHFVSSDYCSKFDFGLKIVKSLNLSSNLIERGSIMKFEDRAKRATDQTLDSTLSSIALGLNMPTVEDVIQNLKENIIQYEKYQNRQ
jgi:dTDP-4-dehydrorhamnose reductase